MASPQLENGYTKIANEIIDALTAYRLPGEQMQCLLLIIRKTYGFNKIDDMISNSQFVSGTGLKKPNVCRAIKGLIDKNIVIKKDNNYVPTYQFNKNYKTWKVLSKKITAKSVIKIDNQVLSKKIPTKETITKENNIYTPVCEKIIAYLNSKTDKNFKLKTPKTISFIMARIKEGFNFDNFMTVIDKKTFQWIDTDMSKYLRPETLFGTKFESYLNEKDIPKQKTEDSGYNEIVNKLYKEKLNADKKNSNSGT